MTQNQADNHSLLPLGAEVERQCGSPPQPVLADAGFFSLENVPGLEQRGIDA